MKWTADAAVLQNVDFSSQFVKWIRDGPAPCQTKVATSPSEQNNETIATNCRNMKLVPQKLSTVGCFACTQISWEVVALLVLLFACWVVVVVVVLLLGGCWGLLGAHS